MKTTATECFEMLKGRGYSVAILSGNGSLKQRMDSFLAYRTGARLVLLTTNFISRGLDVPQTQFIVNFDMPLNDVRREPNLSVFSHRVNRTGRFGKRGAAISLLRSDVETSAYHKVAHHFGFPIKEF